MKKLLSLIMIIVMILSLCACAGSKNSNGNDKTTAKTQKVMCLTKIVSLDEGAEYVYNVTYKEDGVHITPEESDLSTANFICEAVYNADGRILSELSYRDGVNTHRNTYTYNELGFLTENLYWDVEDDCLASRVVYTYNSQNQLVKKEHENRANQISYHEYIYADNGVLTEKRCYNTNGAMFERYVYTANSAGQLQSCVGYRAFSDNKPMSEWGAYTYSYDSDGSLLSKVWENVGTSIISNLSYYYAYDENGNVTLSKDGDYETTYSYNEDGYLVGLVYDEGSTNTFVYTEVELTEDQAEMAQQWSVDGVKKAYVEDFDLF